MKRVAHRRLSHFIVLHRNIVISVLGVIVGLAGGLGAVFFRYLISFFQRLIYGQTGDLSTILSGLPWWWVLLGPALGGAVVGPVIYFFAREAKGHGVPEVMNAVAVEGGIIRKRVVFVKTLASAVCIGSGGSVGREGPIVQIGSAIGSSLGQMLGLRLDQMRILVGCGAAAGIAATFNAPMAGAIFALEVVLADFTLATFTPIVLSSVCATAVSRFFLGNHPAFKVPAYHLATTWEFGFYVCMGLVSGLVASAFIYSLYKSEDLWDKIKIPEYLKAAIGGLLIGGIGIYYPQVMGLGYGTIEQTLIHPEVWTILLVLAPIKILATSLTIGSGGSGGILAPSLFMGAMAGGAFGLCVNALFPWHTAAPEAYALIGMGAVVAGATHAPIQAFLIIFELTQDYKIMPALMICCVLSAALAHWINRGSIYTLKLLRRGVDIRAGRDVNLLKDLPVKDYMTSKPETVREDTPLREVVQKLPHSHHTSFPVINDQEELLGMISLSDFREYVFEETVHDVVVVSDIASTPAISVTTEDNLATSLSLMNENGIHCLPVTLPTGGSKTVVGILSQRDVIAAYDRTLESRGLKQLIPSSGG
jgi:CIC family chloride channel protein